MSAVWICRSGREIYRLMEGRGLGLEETYEEGLWFYGAIIVKRVGWRNLQNRRGVMKIEKNVLYSEWKKKNGI